MSHYEEMRTVLPDDVWNDARAQHNGWQVSMRRCECGYLLGTNHKGDFACNGCGYRDHQDVSHLAGLNWRNEKNRLSFRYGRRV